MRFLEGIETEMEFSHGKLRKNLQGERRATMELQFPLDGITSGLTKTIRSAKATMEEDLAITQVDIGETIPNRRLQFRDVAANTNRVTVDGVDLEKFKLVRGADAGVHLSFEFTHPLSMIDGHWFIDSYGMLLRVTVYQLQSEMAEVVPEEAGERLRETAEGEAEPPKRKRGRPKKEG